MLVYKCDICGTTKETIVKLFEKKAKSQVEWTNQGFIEPNVNWCLRLEIDKFLKNNDIITITEPYFDKNGNCCGQLFISIKDETAKLQYFGQIFNQVAKETRNIYKCYYEFKCND